MAKIVDKYGGTIVVAFSGDEEIGGANGARILREYLRSNKMFPSYMVNADGSGMVVINRRRNAFKITIEANARRASVKGSIMRVRRELASRSYHACIFHPRIGCTPSNRSC